MPTQETIIRDDDIFLTESPTQGRQLYSLEKFKAVHEYIHSRGFKHHLAIIASEIENYPELVEYIKQHKDECVFGVHGWAHDHYARWNREPIAISFNRAKQKIKDVFEVDVEWFFPPWNELSPSIMMAATDAKLKVNVSQVDPSAWLKGQRANAICIHYWSDDQIGNLKKILG